MRDSELEGGLTAEHKGILERFGFRADRLMAHRELLRAGLASDANTVRASLRPPTDRDLGRLAPVGSSERKRLEDAGLEAAARGEIGAVVLNGGMATRFGGVVKASVEAAAGLSFLSLKLRDLQASARRAGGSVPVYLMNSFATEARTNDLLVKDGQTDVGCFSQSVSVRLTSKGDLFLDDAGLPSLYAPGHGDLVESMRAPHGSSSVLGDLRARGVRHVVMSNVDNLAASVDSALVGFHLFERAEMTVEVVRKDPGDKGGAPAWLDGRLQIIESFRFPRGFDQDSIAVFNTNTFILDLEAIDRDFPLDFFAVKKTVDGREAFQFERLAGQLSAFLQTRYIEVPRSGLEGRFLPIKDPEELEARRREIELLLRHRGAL